MTSLPAGKLKKSPPAGKTDQPPETIPYAAPQRRHFCFSRHAQPAFHFSPDRSERIYAFSGKVASSGQPFFLSFNVRTSPYLQRLEHLLREIPAIERSLADCQVDTEKRSLLRSLRRREKQLDQTLSYQELRQLAFLCKQAGIQATFI